MPFTSRVSAICAAGLLAAHFTHAVPLVTARDGLLDKLPQGINGGICDGPNNYNTDYNRKLIWNNANGWEIVDSYLNQNGASYWTQNIYKTMFPQEVSSNFDCSTSDANCQLGKSCKDFEAQGIPGAFYLFASMQNLHAYFKQYLHNLNWLGDKLRTDIDKVCTEMGANEKAAEDLDIGAIVGGALAFASTATSPVPGVSGSLGAASGIAGILATVLKKEGKGDLGRDAKYAVSQAVANMIESSYNHVNTVRGAMFGVDGPNEADIPTEMKWNNGGGAGKDWVHAITWVLGDGQWLLDRPAESLAPDFDNARLKIKQMVAFQMVRLLKGGFVVIDDNTKDEAKCLQDQNSAWDAEKGWCYTMYQMENGFLRGGINEPAWPLWKPESEGGYGMDKLATYRNAIHCWESNDAHMGDAVLNDITAGTDLPRCFFGMEVKKGAFFEKSGDGFDGKNLRLDTNYPNFPKAEKSQATWPQFECTRLLTNECQ